MEKLKVQSRTKGSLIWASLLLILSACSGAAIDADASTSTALATTTTTIVDRPLGASVLLEAIPDAMDLPTGWTASGNKDSSLTGILEPASGLGFGFCSGPNRDEQLIRSGVVAWAWSPLLELPSAGKYSFIAIFEFPDSAAATQFIEASSSNAACGSEEWKAIELGEGKSAKDTPDTPRVSRFDGSDNSTKWDVRAAYSVGGALPSSKAPGLTVLTTWEYFARRSGTDFGDIEQQVLGYEQYQNIVLRFSIMGGCCIFGYANSETNSDDTRPTMAALDEMASQVRLKILVSLGLDKVHE